MNELMESPIDTSRLSRKSLAIPPVQSVCVYCGSSKGLNGTHAIAARKFGKALADNGIRLVYGGGSLGLMGEVARAALGAGGKVTGVIPEFLVNREKMLKDVDDLIVVQNMHTRKQLMFDRSDAFVALPGGIGTLEELVEQLTWSQLGRHTKPIIVANVDDFWAPFLDLIKHMKRQAFIGPEFDLHYTVVNRIEDVLPAIFAGVESGKVNGTEGVLSKF
jgi:uncharacterized protein (TIGR00730 family)